MGISLKDKTVLITGASSGIGKACAQQFSKEGAKLIITARRLENLQSLAEELPTKVYPVKLDIRDKKAIKTCLQELPEEFDSIDILVNNAGLASGLEKLYEASDDDFDVMIDTNVKGLLYITRAVVKQMVEKNNGHIINIGSIAGHEPYANGAVYCATKAAVRSISRALKMDLLGTDIRVSSVDPGMVKTDFSEVRFHGDKEQAAKVYEGVRPLTADDIADAVVYCATRPQHVNVSEMLILSTDQVSANVVHREVD